ncbi:MAG: hypothetical protein ACI9OJ_001956, partial [Myxococcota bacterium]
MVVGLPWSAAIADDECVSEPIDVCFVEFKAPVSSPLEQDFMNVVGSWAEYNPKPTEGAIELVSDGGFWIGYGYFESGLELLYKFHTSWSGIGSQFCTYSADAGFLCDNAEPWHVLA